LFGVEVALDSILLVQTALLQAHPGWYAKADILAVTGITDGQWNTSIAELTVSGRVKRQGEKRGAQHSFTRENNP